MTAFPRTLDSKIAFWLGAFLILSALPNPLHAQIRAGMTVDVDGIHSFAGDPEPQYNYGDTSRWMLAGIHLRQYNSSEATLLFGLDANILLNLGSSTIEHPAMPSVRSSHFVETSRRPVLSRISKRAFSESPARADRRDPASKALHIIAGEYYLGLKQRMDDVLGSLGHSAEPSISLILGRHRWRTEIQEEFLGSPGYFPGLHFIWDTDGYGKAVISPAYILDNTDSTGKEWGLSRRLQNGAGLSASSFNSHRYGSSAFYILGNSWQLGMGVRRHSLRRNSRLYLPGLLQYLHFFAGYRGKHFRLGLGYSRVIGELQKPRRTRSEKQRTEEFKPVPRPGKDRNEQDISVKAAEVHGVLGWQSKSWSLTLSFFLPESIHGDKNPELGYVHPGRPPYSMPLGRFYGIASGFETCASSPACSDLSVSSENLYGQIQIRADLKWSGYRTYFLALYSGARTQSKNGLAGSAPDPEAPDYLEWQAGIRKSWNFLRSGSLTVQYGRIYIRKTRSSQAFAEYFRLGLKIKLRESMNE